MQTVIFRSNTANKNTVLNFCYNQPREGKKKANRLIGLRLPLPDCYILSKRNTTNKKEDHFENYTYRT